MYVVTNLPGWQTCDVCERVGKCPPTPHLPPKCRNLRSNDVYMYMYVVKLGLLTNKMCLIPWSGFQSLLRVLTHIAPLLATLGWKILVRKKPAQTHESVY